MTKHIPVDDLSAYLDDEVSGAERQAVDDHLSSCSECRRQLESLARTVAYLRAAPRAAMPAGTTFHVPVPRRGARRGRIALGRGAPWAMGTLVAAVVVLTFALGNLTLGPLGLRLAGESAAPVALQEGDRLLAQGDAGLPSPAPTLGAALPNPPVAGYPALSEQTRAAPRAGTAVIPPEAGGGGDDQAPRPEAAAMSEDRGAAAATAAAADTSARTLAAVPEAEDAGEAAVSAGAVAAKGEAAAPIPGQLPWRGLLVAALLLLDVAAVVALVRMGRGAGQ